MADQNPITTSPETTTTETNFLSGTETVEKDTLYSDLFEKTADGEVKQKTENTKSWLEIITNILWYVASFGAVIAVLFAGYAFIRGQEDSGLTENFQFLCPIVNAWIDLDSDEKWCKNATIIKAEYDEKNKGLEKSIVSQLATYVPLKLANSGINSKEKNFIKTTYENKIDYVQMMKDFDKIVNKSRSAVSNNINCENISITNWETISVKCDIRGSKVGVLDDQKTLGSARIEATRFLEEISNTPESKFLVENPPTILTIEKIENSKDPRDEWYGTKTTVSLTMKYISVNSGI